MTLQEPYMFPIIVRYMLSMPSMVLELVVHSSIAIGDEEESAVWMGGYLSKMGLGGWGRYPT